MGKTPTERAASEGQARAAAIRGAQRHGQAGRTLPLPGEEHAHTNA